MGSSTPEFQRPHHRAIGNLLARLDAAFLDDAQCYFGGGTRIALALGEYRESRGMDFLCATREGFKKLRETITQESLGAIAWRPLHLAREVRADSDGICTFVAVGEYKVKFEIVLEARIELAGALDPLFNVPTPDIEYTIAEKFLANTDRGLDASTSFSDLVDLAFLAASRGQQEIRQGLLIAEGAYGTAVRRHLTLVLDQVSADRLRVAGALRALGVSDAVTLRRGIRMLRRLAGDPVV